MAENLFINDTNFAGTFANQMIVRTTLDMDTVEKGCIYVIDGIKKSYSIPRIDLSNFVQDRAATPTPGNGAITVDRMVLTPQDYMVYLEFNPRDYEQHWYSYQLNKNLLDATLPETAESYTVFQLLRRLGEWNERATWRSRKNFHQDSATYQTATSVGQAAGDQQYKYFDGLIYKMLLDATILRPSGSQIAITATYSGTNGFYPFEQCLNALASSANGESLLFKYGKAGTKFHIGSNTQLKYEEFLTFQMQYKNNDATERSINRYRGYEVETLRGIPDNTVVLTVSQPNIDSNLFIGLNSKDDESMVQLQRLQNNSEMFFIKMLMKADPSHGFGDMCVLYTTITA